jgi:translation initiation factor IF-2
VPEGTIVVERGVSAQEFGPKLNRTAADVVKFLLQHGEMVTATMALSDEHMELFALELGADLLLVDPGQQQEVELQALFDDSDDDDEDLLQTRPPVITVMGHVDHGKTTVLDKIRHANVVAGEAGGITQHIGAYQVERNGEKLTFIDTPGHAAFTQMRARGAQATDIVVLVVAADDGVMPQTIEAINHARAAEVPIIVAVNKIDKDNADPQRVLTQLAEHQLVPESWGGDTIVVEMSALQELGIDDLLDQLLVVSELEELQANPTGRAKGIVLEANLDKGRGPVATILVDKGELKVGDPIVAGAAWGRVRAMINDKGEQVKTAGPSTPVEVLGLSSVPEAGDEFRAAPDERIARTVGEAREHHRKIRDQRGDARVKSGVKLEDIFDQIQSGETANLNLILKADVHGSLEAVTESLRKLGRDEVDLTFVHRAVGGITENDITLAATTNATIIGFNVRPDRKARELADQERVEIRTYEIIYKLLEDIEQAMVGMLAPEYEEVVTRRCRGARDLPGAAHRCDRRLLRPERRDQPWLEGSLPARRRHHLEGRDRFAPSLQRRRGRGPLRVRVRHRPHRLPGSQAGRRHRDLRRARDRPHAQLTFRSSGGHDMAGRGRKSSTGRGGGHRYPRSARVGETLREIIADELVRIDDERLTFVTVTGIDVDDELNRAHVFFDSLEGEEGDPEIIEALSHHRVRLQGAIARQIRAKKTPILDFRPDVALRSAERIDDILREDRQQRGPLPDDYGIDETEPRDE